MDKRAASSLLVFAATVVAMAQPFAQSRVSGDAQALPVLLLREVESEALPAAPMLHAKNRRVRALSRPLQDLLSEGFHRSPTFSRVLQAIERTDVIVQIEAVRHLKRSTPARVLMGAAVQEVRFVRLQIGDRCAGDDRIALIGHELFHALEIARSPEVRDESTLLALYRRIGYQDGGPYQFDTAEALVIERRIRGELLARTN